MRHVALTILFVCFCTSLPASDVLLTLSGSRKTDAGGSFPYTEILNLTTGEVIIDDLFFVIDMVVSEGVLYLPGGSRTVSMYDASDGTPLGQLSTSLYGLPTALEADDAGNIYIVSGQGKGETAIEVFDNRQEFVSRQLFPTTSLNGKFGLNNRNEMHVLTQRGGSKLAKYSESTGEFESVVSGPRANLAFDSNDNIYLLAGGLHDAMIEKYDPTGEFLGHVFSIEDTGGGSAMAINEDSLYLSYREKQFDEEGRRDSHVIELSLDGELTNSWRLSDVGVTTFAFFDGESADIRDPVFVSGDLNGDGQTDVDDLDFLANSIRNGADDPQLDLDGNGTVDFGDHRYWVHEIKDIEFGDTDMDGVFETSDLIDVFKAAEYDDGTVANSTWRTGDFNGDGEFDTDDLFTIWWSGKPVEITAVPEPTGAVTLLSLLAGVLALIRRQKRSKLTSLTQ